MQTLNNVEEWSCDPEPVFRSLMEHLGSVGWCVVRGIPAGQREAETIRLAEFLGKPCPAHADGSNPVYRVEVSSEASIDTHGSEVISTTDRAFLLHSDGAGRARPYDFVLLTCESAAEVGGETLLLSVQDLISYLPADATRLLADPVYPFHCGQKPILTLGDVPTIRFNGECIAVLLPLKDRTRSPGLSAMR
jgi:hypothetical protein